ncbi:sigma-70 family RNA polymerase sigma factor [Amycolatopsis anabasis]|uniref:sigma-70 family RNA polymerase sigma factor n=1 Tax=Amycolatopsis anabasis TaxID=1840409 RepID=UPI00131AA5EB|nr:sigma-70 family RNA polymerase sigma factor [Amycolatopsis anabasis]
MNEHELLAEQFEANRTDLRAVAYRMLGSLSEADDAVQEAWLRLNRAAPSGIENLAAWLTTVVGRVCLDMLRARRSRRENALETAAADPPAHGEHGDPEREALLADSVGLALLVVLDTLDPAERLAFVLHDMFAVPFNDIAPIVERTPEATRQLASRARRRVRGADRGADPDLVRQRRAVEAFLTAAREGDFDALVAVLDPGIVARSDGGPAASLVRGATAVAQGAVTFAAIAGAATLALVDGRVGVISAPGDRPSRVLKFTVVADRVTELVVITDPDRLRELDLELLGSVER